MSVLPPKADIGQLRRHRDWRHDTGRQSLHLRKVPHLHPGNMAQARPTALAARRRRREHRGTCIVGLGQGRRDHTSFDIAPTAKVAR
jgi:hypothetical protein